MTKTSAFTAVIGAASALLATPALAQSSIPIYQNVSDYSGLYLELTSDGQVGDEITFAGSFRTLTDFKLEYFLSPGASVNAQVLLRQMDGPNGAPGTPLYDSGILSLLDGFGHIEAFGLSLEVPDTITWSIHFTGLSSGGTVGLLYYENPTIGSSQDDFWRLVPGEGWVLFDTPNIKDNFGAEFNAVPEPTTWALLLGGMGVLGFMQYRRRS
jgi:hypothetical protein